MQSEKDAKRVQHIVEEDPLEQTESRYGRRHRLLHVLLLWHRGKHGNFAYRRGRHDAASEETNSTYQLRKPVSIDYLSCIRFCPSLLSCPTLPSYATSSSYEGGFVAYHSCPNSSAPTNSIVSLALFISSSVTFSRPLT